MSSSRIFYIDALKAFAIVLVVMGHMSHLWTNENSQSIYLPILSAFHMPLFMSLSGYVTNVDTFKIAKKAKLLIPFFVFGLAWTAYQQLPLLGFFEHEAKAGYWFLYVLFMFFVFLSLIRATKQNLYIGMGIIQVVLMGLHFLFHRTIPGTTLSTDHMFQLWPFFCYGIILRKGILNICYSHKFISLIICLLGIILMLGVQFTLHLTSTLLIYSNDLMSLYIVPLLFILFHEVERRLKGKTNKIKSIVKFLGHQIGINTLQIYVLQYFVIHVFTLFFGEFCKSYLVECELIFSPILGIILCLICVLVSELMHKLKLGFVFGR